MIQRLFAKRPKRFVKRLLRIPFSPTEAFVSSHYARHNERRLDHLASLGLDIESKTVLEVGAGIGSHTGFFLERGCRVLSTEARPENLKELAANHPGLETRLLDLESPSGIDASFDIVYCYGTLYHLKEPVIALDYMADHCKGMLLLETCVSYGDELAVNLTTEDATNPTQSFHGVGCRPTRPWLFDQLKQRLQYVYVPTTQPDHEEFPLDWTRPNGQQLTRAVFIASREKIDNSLLLEQLPLRQMRHVEPESVSL